MDIDLKLEGSELGHTAKMIEMRVVLRKTKMPNHLVFERLNTSIEVALKLPLNLNPTTEVLVILILILVVPRQSHTHTVTCHHMLYYPHDKLMEG